jgi:hypothetical protein
MRDWGNIFVYPDVRLCCFGYSVLHSLELSKLAHAVTFLTCIWKIPGLNLSQDSNCLDIFLWFPSVPQIRGNGLLLPCPIKFINYPVIQ